MKPFSFALSPLRSALLAAVLCLPGVGYMAGAQAQLALPSMGDGADLTASEERRLGDSIIASLYRDPDYIDDPQLHAYVPGRFCWAGTRALTPLPCPVAIWGCTWA